MPDKDKNNTFINSSHISSEIKSKETFRIDYGTIKAGKVSQTIKTPQDQVISAGISPIIKVDKDNPLQYEFNGKKYKLLSKISDSSTEAEIFLIKNEDDKFVLKLYYPFVKPKFEIVEKLSSLDHPDILKVIDSGFFNGRFFEILPYADQGSLADILPIKDKVQIKLIVKEVVNALQFCHENGIIHRDIKPTNIFIKSKDSQNVLVGDFGIASMVDKGEELRRTSIFQTPIYAAPEYKISLSGQTYITKAVDYYALGITVWELFIGKLPPKNMDDLEFLRLMFEGSPPLSSEIDQELSKLIKGLTTRDYKKRWAYDEVQKWLKGEPVQVHEEEHSITYTNKFEFGEDSNGEKVYASTPEELASLIYEYPDEGRKLLYRGLVSEWLKKINNRKLFLEIADVVEYQFKGNEKAGTFYSVYLLDKNFPYYSVNNKPLRKKKELIEELENNFEVYKERLKNPHDRFYLYLLANKAEKEVETFRLLFEKEERDEALYKVIFTLKLSLESRVSFDFEFGGKLIRVDNPKSLSKFLVKNPTLSKQILNNKKFLIWLDLTDNTIYQEYQKKIAPISTQDSSLILPYVLSPDMGYIGINGNECFSLVEFGEEFYNHFNEYLNILKDNDSHIFDYLKYHGLTGEVEFFNQVFDMEKASPKPGAYNDKIALYKIIKGTEYHCGISVDGIQLNSPDDLLLNEAKSSDVIRQDLEDKNSHLFAWLSVFFHEYPLNDENNFYYYYREDYEQRFKSFVEYLRKIDPGNKFVERYDEANEKVASIRDNFENFKDRIRFEVLTAYLLPVAVAVILFIYILVFENINIPGNIFSLGEWYFLIFALVFTAFYFWSAFSDSDFSFSAGCIGAPIIGLIISIAAYYIFYFVIFTPFLLAIVLGLGYFYVFRQIKNNSHTFYEAGESYRNSLNLTEMENLVFAYTFEKIDEIDITYSEELSALRSTLQDVRFNIWIFSIIYTVLITFILILLIFNTPSIL